MQTVIGILVGLIVLTLLIVAHEYGHFRAARRNGVRVLEFAVGFGPHIVAWIVNPEYLKWRATKKPARAKSKKNVDVKSTDTRSISAKAADTKSVTAKTANPKNVAHHPPRLLKLPRSEWGNPQNTLILALNWLPLGGYCQMDGESDADERKGTFGAASFWAKTKILFAGVAMNWLTAFVILTVLAWTGMPHFIENQFQIASDTIISGDSVVEIVEVIEDTPAASADFRAGDRLLRVCAEAGDSSNASSGAETNTSDYATETNSSCIAITSATDITSFNSAHSGKTVYYEVLREKAADSNDGSSSVNSGSPTDPNNPDNPASVSKTLTLPVALNPAGATYSLGIKMSESGQTLYRSTWSAPLVGAGTTVQLTLETYKGIGAMLGNLFSGIARQFSTDGAVREAGREAIGAAGDSVSGPIGIIGVLFPAFTSAGATNLAYLTALISISLACMNVLPIPALDGGRWLLIAIARLRGKKLRKETEEKIVSRTFIVLLALFALICVLDILRLI